MGNRHPKFNRHQKKRFERADGAFYRQKPMFSNESPEYPTSIRLQTEADEANSVAICEHDRKLARGYRCYQLSVNAVGDSGYSRARGMGNKSNAVSEKRAIMHRIQDVRGGQPSDANAQKYSYFSLRRTPPATVENSMALSASRRANVASPGTDRREGSDERHVPPMVQLPVTGRGTTGASSSHPTQRREDEFEPYRRGQGYFQGRQASPMAKSSLRGQRREDAYEPYQNGPGYFYGRQARPAAPTYPQRWGSAFQPYRRDPMEASPVETVTPRPRGGGGNAFRPYQWEPFANRGGLFQRLKSRMRSNFIKRKISRANKRYSAPPYGFAPNWNSPTNSQPAAIRNAPPCTRRCCSSSVYPDPNANCMAGCHALEPAFEPREERGSNHQSRMRKNFWDRREKRRWESRNAGQRNDAALDSTTDARRAISRRTDNQAGGGLGYEDSADMADAHSYLQTSWVSNRASARRQSGRRLQTRDSNQIAGGVNRVQVVRNQLRQIESANEEKTSLRSFGSGSIVQGSAASVSSSTVEVSDTTWQQQRRDNAGSGSTISKSVEHRYTSSRKQQQTARIDFSPTRSDVFEPCRTCREVKAGSHEVIQSYLSQTLPRLADQQQPRRDWCNVVDPNCTCACARSREGRTLHSSNCPCRPVECPDQSCASVVPFRELLPHIQKRHPLTQWLGEIRPHHFSKQYWNIRSGDNFSAASNSWVLTVWRYSGQTFVTMFEKREEKWYAWLYLIGGRELARSFEYQIRLRRKDDASRGMVYRGVAHAIDETKSDIRGRKDCLVLSDKAVGVFMTRKGLSGERRKQGYDYRLPLEFKIVEKQILLPAPTVFADQPAIKAR
ncbi:unnamed protein product [Sphagnum tenellum]